MSKYKSRYTGEEIDSAIDAMSAIAPAKVRVYPDSTGKYVLEMGKLYQIKNSNASHSVYGFSVSTNAFITLPGFEDSRKITKLQLPEVLHGANTSDGIILKLLRTDSEAESFSTTIDDVDVDMCRYRVMLEYHAYSAGVFKLNYMFTEEYIINHPTTYTEYEETFDDIYKDHLVYEVYVDGATDVFIVNEDDATLTLEPGISPHIGENGNWWIGDEDTGVKAQGDSGEAGESGKSAYDIAVENGFVGTKQEWLDSLVFVIDGDELNAMLEEVYP